MDNLNWRVPSLVPTSGSDVTNPNGGPSDAMGGKRDSLRISRQQGSFESTFIQSDSTLVNLPSTSVQKRIYQKMLRLAVPSFSRPCSKLLHPSLYGALTRTVAQRAGLPPKGDHVVDRTDANNAETEAAQSAMKEKKEGKEGAQSISQKDEGKFNKKAEETNPEAPTPVIGCALRLSKVNHLVLKIC
jgi:hypothetical protein